MKKNIYYQTGFSMFILSIFQLVTSIYFKESLTQILRELANTIVVTLLMFLAIYIYNKLKK